LEKHVFVVFILYVYFFQRKNKGLWGWEDAVIDFIFFVLLYIFFSFDSFSDISCLFNWYLSLCALMKYSYIYLRCFSFISTKFHWRIWKLIIYSSHAMNILVYFYWLHSVNKNSSISETPYFQKIYCRIFIPEWKWLSKARSAQNITKKKGFREGNILKILQLNKVSFPCRSSRRLEVAFGRQPYKVRVRYLFGRPIGREPPRALVRYLSGRPNGCEPPRAPVCKDVRTQKWGLQTEKLFSAIVRTLGQAIWTPFSKT